MKTLVLLSATFPGDGVTERAFLNPEIESLARRFDRVILAPAIRPTSTDFPALPANVVVDSEFGGYPSVLAKIAGLFDPAVWSTLYADRKQLGSLSDIRSDIAESIYIRHFERRIKALVRRYNLDVKHTLFYSFWLNFVAYAVTAIPGTRVISRAHRYDVFHEEEFLSRSRRRKFLESALAVYPVSQVNTDYIRSNYPDAKARIETRYMGSAHVDLISPKAPAYSPASEIRLLSVARIAEVKRIPLLIERLSEVAANNPSKRYTLLVVGDGPEAARARKQAELATDNLLVSFLGMLDNESVHHLMDDPSLTALVLASRSEGAPIVLMEALSHELPCIACRADGMPEIVDDSCGVLIPVDYSAADLDAAINTIKSKRQDMGQLGRIRWELMFDAAPLREAWSNELLAHLSDD